MPLKLIASGLTLKGRPLLARVHELLELHEVRPLDDQLSELVAEHVLVRDEGEG